MRIKFRAWDKKNKCWYYLHLNQGWIKQDLEFHREIAMKGGKLYQYTGLKDKNGKEIYEGDIVMLTIAEGGIREVKFIDGTFTYGCGVNNFYKKTKNGDAKVIGNIHKNPELLNK